MTPQPREVFSLVLMCPNYLHDLPAHISKLWSLAFHEDDKSLMLKSSHNPDPLLCIVSKCVAVCYCPKMIKLGHGQVKARDAD